MNSVTYSDFNDSDFNNTYNNLNDTYNNINDTYNNLNDTYNNLNNTYNNLNATYCNLLQRASKSTLYLSRLWTLAIEIFKFNNDISPFYMKSLFIKRCIGHKTIRYQSSNIYNNLVVLNNIKKVE